MSDREYIDTQNFYTRLYYKLKEAIDTTSKAHISFHVLGIKIYSNYTDYLMAQGETGLAIYSEGLINIKPELNDLLWVTIGKILDNCKSELTQEQSAALAYLFGESSLELFTDEAFIKCFKHSPISERLPILFGEEAIAYPNRLYDSRSRG